MSGKSSRPVIGKLAGIPLSGKREPVVDGSISPRSPLDLKSPRGPKSYDLGAVGLAIVAALENSRHREGEFLAYRPVYYRKNSNPIPVFSGRNSGRPAGEFDQTDMESSEDEEDEEYTLVTCHGPDNKSYTRVYFDSGVIGSQRSRRPTVFVVSPAKAGGLPGRSDSGGFLSSCDMCHKSLQGKDIFMYRGEKAFCSWECRNREILSEDYSEKKKWGSEIPRSADVSGTKFHGQMVSNGILAV
ncbi:unnamed protein product [Cuscuta campestris]|uniref:FLZ-type domain-containing protein n=1 Tax=Cuscuta campestris TaxID=132261 RepID=A0A484MUE2_9ASTE|nr:unnamed protein product [Cuscuta campestris]